MSEPEERVLFVCMGNICRSPTAENVFRKMIDEAGLSARIGIDSAGTIGYHAGSRPDERMAATLQARGYPVTGAARQVRADDLRKFDWVLVADRENLRDVLALAEDESMRGKVRLLTDFCREYEADEVPDPYYGGAVGFETVADLVEDAAGGLLEFLVGEMGKPGE